MLGRPTTTGTTRVLVVTPAISNVVVAYYAWCTAGISLEHARARARKGAELHLFLLMKDIRRTLS